MVLAMHVPRCHSQVSDLEGRSRAYSELLGPVLGPFSSALAGESERDRHMLTGLAVLIGLPAFLRLSTTQRLPFQSLFCLDIYFFFLSFLNPRMNEWI